MFLFLVVKLNGAKSALKEEQDRYQKTLTLANELTSLRKSYFDKVTVQRGINSILSQSILRSANIKKKVSNRNILLSAEALDLASLNYLMSKILNGSYVIGELKIKRVDDEKASLKMEIKW
jgi:hypothetical protein